MKRALILLATASGLFGAVYAKNLRRTDSRPPDDRTTVPDHPRKQARSWENAAINDPAVRAVLERDSKRAMAMLEEAKEMARERVRREAETARQKRLAGEAGRPGGKEVAGKPPPPREEAQSLAAH